MTKSKRTAQKDGRNRNTAARNMRRFPVPGFHAAVSEGMRRTVGAPQITQSLPVPRKEAVFAGRVEITAQVESYKAMAADVA